MKARMLRPIVACLGLVLAVAFIPTTGIADPLDPNVVAAVHANNEFALDLYQRLIGTPNENVVLSPYSISSALAMAYAGAAGQTATEMADALHFTLPPEQLHPAFAQLNDRWNYGQPGEPIESRVANRLWGQQGLNYVQNFLNITSEYYGAEMGQADFINAPEDAREEINDWVEQQTHNKIQDLLLPGSIQSSTRLALANAVYFRGEWATPFDPFNTNPSAEFVNEIAQPMPVSMMHQFMPHGYAQMPGYQALQLKYRGEELYTTSDFSMLILLPDGDLATFEQSLSINALEDCVSQLDVVEVVVDLPKFSIDSGYLLRSTLEAMGMVQAFGLADFSGITTDCPLFIGDVIHKATIAVNEAGTEAAAATAVTFYTGTDPVPEFRADHPFLYLIRDDVTESILFLGRVANPTYSFEIENVPGDANGDLVVDDEDASILASHWHSAGTWEDGDFDGDGWVNDKDASILASHWHAGMEGTAPTVPEPSALVLTASMILGLGMFGFRRVRRG